MDEALIFAIDSNETVEQYAFLSSAILIVYKLNNMTTLLFTEARSDEF